MTTAAERLVELAGTGGVAGTLLLLIGTGSTASAALVNYSGLPSATAAVHLMVDRAGGLMDYVLFARRHCRR